MSFRKPRLAPTLSFIIHRSLFIIIFVFFVSISFAQTKYTLSGYLKDASSGETLIAANIYDKNDFTQGTTSNIYGFYSLTLPEGEYTILAQYLGYADREITVSLNKSQTLNIELNLGGTTMEEIVVTGEQIDRNVESTEMGTVELSTEVLKKIPALLGEVDVLRSLQLLPGVLSAGEGNSGFYVRGGGPDQNLILLDEAVVYNSGHLLGFFSVFNADAIKNTTLIKGGMPASYGGRLSSVVDIQMKDGNNKRFAASGGIGIISSRLTAEGPIVKDRSSFLISGRRTYAFDVAQPAIDRTDFAGTNYYFYDFNTKINHRFSEKDRLYFSGYFGRDVLNYVSSERDFTLNMPWGNSTATLRWNHLFSDKLFMNAMAIYNDYQFELHGEQQEFKFDLFSGVRDWSGKVDFDYYPTPRHQIKWGGQYTHHTFTPYSASATAGDVDFSTDTEKKYAHETAIYLQDEMKLTGALTLNLGLRGSSFTQIGPYTTADSSRVYEPGEPIKTYGGVEPRISAKYSLSGASSIKAGFAYTYQYIHLVSSSTSTLPTDLWVPSTQRVKPQNGTQYALGYFRNLRDNTYETSIEVYYRDLNNQIDYGENYVPDLTTEEEDEFVFGDGRSYGLELFFKKRTGQLNGWVGYTLSRTERTFDDIEEGRYFPTKYDRTHDLSVVANYALNKKWDFGGVFIYGTGNAFTLPQSFYFVNFQVNTKYGPRNGSRLKPYHRLDLSATYTPKAERTDKAFHSSWTFSIYNIYNRRNTFLTYFSPEQDALSGTAVLKAYKVSLFPIIPSVTWNFKWKEKP